MNAIKIGKNIEIVNISVDTKVINMIFYVNDVPVDNPKELTYNMTMTAMKYLISEGFISGATGWGANIGVIIRNNA